MITVDPAAEHERVALTNLLQLYVYDWSELHALDVGEDGRFDDYPIDAYWHDEWRHPFLIRVDGKLAGFALVSGRSRLTSSNGVFDMAEFFVMRRYRREGVGIAAACAVFDLFKGPWEVRQRPSNVEATAFWRRAIAKHTNGAYREEIWNDAVWNGPVQTFSIV